MTNRRTWSMLILLLIVAGGWYVFVRENRENIHLISAISPPAMVALTALMLVLGVLNGYQLKIVTDFYGLQLRFVQWFSIFRLSAFTNMLLPMSGGSVLKAVYLRKFHDLPYISFVAAMSITQLIRLSVLATSMVALLIVKRVPGDEVLLGAAASLSTASLGFLVIAHRVSPRLLPGELLKAAAREWQALRRSHATIVRLIVLNVMILLFSTVRVYTALSIFDVQESWYACGVLSASLIMSRVITIVPGNLGIREAVLVAVGHLEGIALNPLLHAAVLDRLLETVLTVILAAHFAVKLPMGDDVPAQALGDEQAVVTAASSEPAVAGVNECPRRIGE